MPSKRPRIRPYLDEDIYVLLRAAAERPGCTESGIVNDALAAHFKGEHAQSFMNALLRRLDQMTRILETSKRDHIVHAEAFGLFMRYFLTVIPPVGPKDKEAAQAEGHSRFETYLESLRTILADGDPILMSAMDDVRFDESAFFSTEELKLLHEARPEKEPAHA